MEFKKTKNSIMEPIYHGYIKKSYQMKNGWDVLLLVNNVAILFRDGQERIVAGMVKKIVEIEDGKFMIVKKDRSKAVFNRDGKMLADYNIHSNLFHNGWFMCVIENDITLFDENEQIICSKITKAEVFSDGRYYISVLSGGDATKVGFFDADGTLIHFTNDKFFKRLYPNLFIADGSLYNLSGRCLIEANQGSSLNHRLVRCLSNLPLKKS